MSGNTPPSDPTPPPTNVGDIIAADIEVVDSFLSPLVASADPVIGKALHMGLVLVAKAEPAVYRAVVAIIQGTELNPEQIAERDNALLRLQNDPGSYFE